MKKLQLILTKWYVRTYLCGRFKEVKRVTLSKGVEREVIVFSAKESMYLGQATIFGTIIIEESVFSQYSQNVRDYVLTHEYAHTRQKSKYLILPLMLALFFGSYMFLTGVVITFLVFIATLRPGALAVLLFFLICLASVVLIFGGLSWFLEGGADYYVLVQLGKEPVLDAWREIRARNPKSGFARMVFARLTHPKIEFVAKLYDLAHRT